MDTPTPSRTTRRHIMRATFDFEGVVTANLIEVVEDAEAFAVNVAAGPTGVGVLEKVEDVLSGAVGVAALVGRTVGDYPAQVVPELWLAIHAVADRLAAAGGVIREAAPTDAVVRAAYLAAETILRQSADTIRWVAA